MTTTHTHAAAALPVHTTPDEETAGLLEFYPPHPPRVDTAEYRHTHHQLINVEDRPCADCGVRRTTLADPAANPYGAKQMETHHYPLQREFGDAYDPAKVGQDFPQVTDRHTLKAFIDSEANMLVLCDVCHRSPHRGIHHINASLQAAKRYLFTGYVFADTTANEAADEATDAQLTAGENPADQL